MIAIRRNRDAERRPWINWDGVFVSEFADPWDELEENANNTKQYESEFKKSIANMNPEKKRAAMLCAGRLRSATYEDYLFLAIQALRRPIQTCDFMRLVHEQMRNLRHNERTAIDVFLSISDARPARGKTGAYVRVLKKEYRKKVEK